MAVFFIDFNGGLDANAGTSAGAAWQTLEKFSEATRTAGDIAWVRNGVTHPAITTDIGVASDATRAAPIVVKADDGTQWPTDKTTLTNTYTLTYGSTSVTSSATESQLAAGKQVYFGTETNHIHEVMTVSGTAVTIWPPYRGDLTGASNAGVMLPSKPLVDFSAGSFQIGMSSDDFWIWHGLELKDGADSVGMIRLANSPGVISYMTFTFGATSGVEGIEFVNSNAYLSRCRFLGPISTGSIRLTNSEVFCIDCLFDGDSETGSIGAMHTASKSQGTYVNCEFKNHSTGDIQLIGEEGRVFLRNCKLDSTTNFDGYIVSANHIEIYSEDHDQVIGDNRVFFSWDETEDEAGLRTETTTVRSGGSDRSVEITPSSNLNAQTDPDPTGEPGEFGSRFDIFGEAVFYQAAESKTYTIHFNAPAANFTAAPTATELYIELEYWETATARKKLRSTGTIAADGTWDPLTVTATNAIAGEVFLHAYYAKTKEGGKTNVLFCDPPGDYSVS
jgi:hypothetical protein